MPGPRPNGSQAGGEPSRAGRGRDVAVSALLAVLVLAVFGQAVQFDFIPFDDDTYLLENPAIRRGLDAVSLKWAFGFQPGYQYYPLDWLSHALDFTLFGDDPAGHHAVSVVLHAAATVLLFLFLTGTTSDRRGSALVAALFGIHPLRAESVVWITERRDVLSAVLAFLLLIAWARRPRQPSRLYRAGLVLLFLAGLLVKPILVSLPIVLLLVDFWPIRRWEASGGGLRQAGIALRETWPFFALAGFAAIGAVITQKAAGALVGIPLQQRLSVALYGTLWYVWKTILPAGLSIFYPFAVPSGPAVAAGAATVLLLAVLGAHPGVHPAVRTGSLWYLVTLLPVSGIVRVGDQLVADRYSYLPTIGLLLAVVFGLRSVLREAPRRLRQVAGAGAVAVVAAFAASAAFDCGRFRNGMTLFSSALEIDPGNWLAHAKVGDEFVRRGRPREALPRYAEALRLRPDWDGAAGNYAQALASQGRMEEALATVEEGLRRSPSSEWLHRLGAVLFDRAGRPERAQALRTRADTLRRNASADSSPSRARSLRPFLEAPGS